jgi:hypothetical protein
MLLPKGGVSWKSARAQLPPTRVLRTSLNRTRILLLIAAIGVFLFIWRGISSSAAEVQRCARSSCPSLALVGLIANTNHHQLLLLGPVETADGHDAKRAR